MGRVVADQPAGSSVLATMAQKGTIKRGPIGGGDRREGVVDCGLARDGDPPDDFDTSGGGLRNADAAVAFDRGTWPTAADAVRTWSW
jgi:hypothetical protein